VILLSVGLVLLTFVLHIVGAARVWDGGVLAFVSDCGIRSGVYMMDVSRRIVVQIADNLQPSLPKWEGAELDLVAGTTFPIVYYNANSDVVNAGTSGLFLPSSPNEVSNVWGQAPDGRWAIVMFREDNYEIFITDLSHQSAYRLTYNQCNDHYPRWQP
jgi:hypothetical protein